MSRSSAFNYLHPSGVKPGARHGRPALSTQQGGAVVVDRRLLQIWEAAQGKSPQEVVDIFPDLPEDQTRAALACLAAGGLLARDWQTGHKPTGPGEIQSSAAWGLVSAVVVSYNSRKWLEVLFPSLDSQTYPEIEVILVDNGSEDDSAAWAQENYPLARLIRFAKTVPFAQALNAGVEASRGEALLLLNPDLRLEPDFVARITDCARGENPAAAKLRLMWTPGFLNGAGNFVGGFSWGTDFALGHLDLGQWDHLHEVPSACFAAALIPRQVWEAVGPADPGFPMYYEDSEWSYRARLLGYRVLFARQAVAYHAFSGRAPGEPASPEESLSPQKLRRLVYGRLRFAFRLLSPAYFFRFTGLYALEDLCRLAGAILRGRGTIARAILGGWEDFFRDRSDLRQARRALQQRRQAPDAEIFRLQRQAPANMMWHGLPVLTWDAVCCQYLPAIRSGTSLVPPELPEEFMIPGWVPGWLDRARSILALEGKAGLLYKIWRGTQRRLMSV